MSRVLLRLRALLVAALATAVAAGSLHLAAGELVTAARLVGSGGAAPLLDRSFPLLLTWLAAFGLAAAAVWGWAATLAVVAQVLRRPDAASRVQPVAGVPRVVQRLVLAACGAALAGGLALPAHADPGAAGPGPGHTVGSTTALAGLPLPTRATAGDAGVPAAAAGTHTVQPGDSLWSIAAAGLPEGASDAEITRAWQAVHRANRGVVGPDPDLIHPAQQLRLPGR